MKTHDGSFVAALAAMALIAFSGPACHKTDESKGSRMDGDSQTSALGKTAPGKTAPGKTALGKTALGKTALANTTVTLANPPTNEETKAAEELASRLADPTQRSAAIEDKTNARLLVVVAAIHSDPEVIGAALTGLRKVFDKESAWADHDYNIVVGGRLSSSDNAVLAPAILAVRHVRKHKPHDAIQKGVLELVANSANPSGQFEGIRLLRLLSHWREAKNNPNAEKALIQAVDSEADYVVASAISALAGYWHWPAKVPENAAFEAKVKSLLMHTNPAVRGEACGLLVRFVPPRDEAQGAEMAKPILPLLDDSNPFVRSRAAFALGTLKYKPAIHKIIPLLDDPRPNTFNIRGWKTPAGKKGWSHHDGSVMSRVDDAAVAALRLLTHNMVTAKAVGTDGKTETVVAIAKDWYAANKDTLPTAP